METVPVFTYLQKGDLEKGVWKEGGFRILSMDGREGLLADSIYSRIIIRNHTVNETRGSLTFWMFPMEDMGSQACPIHMPQFEENIQNYMLLTDDQIEYNDVEEAAFALMYRFNWNDQLFAKFYKGKIGRGALYPQHAITVGGQLALEKDNWYQVGVSWNREEGDYRIYVNGIQISRSTIFLDKTVVASRWAKVVAGAGSVKSSAGTYTACTEVTEPSLVEAIRSCSSPISVARVGW